MSNDTSPIGIENRRFTYINAAGEAVVLEVGEVLESRVIGGVEYGVRTAWEVVGHGEVPDGE